MLEMRHADLKKMDGYSHYEARQSAKHMGLRRKPAEFNNIKWDLYSRMQAAGFGQHWIDVSQYPPTADVLSWCVALLPFRAQTHTPSQTAHHDSMVDGDDPNSLVGGFPRERRRRSRESDEDESRAKCTVVPRSAKNSAGNLEVRLPEPNTRHEPNPSQQLVRLLGGQ